MNTSMTVCIGRGGVEKVIAVGSVTVLRLLYVAMIVTGMNFFVGPVVWKNTGHCLSIERGQVFLSSTVSTD